jgi:hypothetical protein
VTRRAAGLDGGARQTASIDQGIAGTHRYQLQVRPLKEHRRPAPLVLRFCNRIDDCDASVHRPGLEIQARNDSRAMAGS